MSQAILSVLASDLIQTTTITGYYNIHALFHDLFYPSFLYNHTYPSVNFINRSAAIRLIVSSTSAPTSYSMYSVSIIKTFSSPRACLTQNAQGSNNGCRGNQNVKVRTSPRTQNPMPMTTTETRI